MMHQHNFTSPIRGIRHATYRLGEVNHCPGCGRTNWLLGNTTAECAFCATALPYAGETVTGRPAFFQRGNSQPGAARGRFTINGRAA